MMNLKTFQLLFRLTFRNLKCHQLTFYSWPFFHPLHPFSRRYIEGEVFMGDFHVTFALPRHSYITEGMVSYHYHVLPNESNKGFVQSKFSVHLGALFSLFSTFFGFSWIKQSQGIQWGRDKLYRKWESLFLQALHSDFLGRAKRIQCRFFCDTIT